MKLPVVLYRTRLRPSFPHNSSCNRVALPPLSGTMLKHSNDARTIVFHWFSWVGDHQHDRNHMEPWFFDVAFAYVKAVSLNHWRPMPKRPASPMRRWGYDLRWATRRLSKPVDNILQYPQTDGMKPSSCSFLFWASKPTVLRVWKLSLQV